jgi:hypothetical protein
MNLRRLFVLAFVLTAFVAITFGQGIPVGDNPVPTITLIQPSSALRAQTLDVLIQGTSFVSGVTMVDFGVNITVNSVVINSSTRLIANISVDSTATLGPRAVAVANPSPGGGIAVLTNGFVVGTNPVPTLSSVSPSTARRLDRLDVSFRGTNFIPGVTIVDLGPEILINTVTVDSWTGLTANVTVSATAALGARTVYIGNPPPGGGYADLAAGFTVTNAPQVSVSEPAGLPAVFTLQQNYPNPFNPSTIIRYGLPRNAFVKLVVYNTLGEQVALLLNEDQEAGYHEVKFDAAGLSSGVYFYRMQSGAYVGTKKLILTK